MDDLARSLTIAFAASTFQEIGVAVSVWSKEAWRAIHVLPYGLVEFEVSRRRELGRWAYNDRSIKKARAARRPVLGRYNGCCDLFVPVVAGDEVPHVLVAGPFLLERPTSTEIAERWYAMSGSHASPADPEFGLYLTTTLAMLTLEGPLAGVLEALLLRLAALLAARGTVRALAEQWDPLARRLLRARDAERMWEAARSMCDERVAARWTTPIMRDPLERLGFARPPSHAVVALARARSARDPIDEVVRFDSFRRAAAAYAKRRGGIVCGTVGDRGIVLLSCDPPGMAASRSLADLAGRASAIARRFDLGLSAGIALGSPTRSLPDCFRAALGAADRAQSCGVSIAMETDVSEPSPGSLAQLRARLSSGLEEQPHLLSSRFERYADAVLAATGARASAARPHLQAGLERLADGWLSSGLLEPKTFDEVCHIPDHVASIADLVEAYRRAAADLGRLVESPTAARQDRSIDRALVFVREHLAEPLTRARVARVAGFASSHFARLLKRMQNTTFERLVRSLRLERAKHMLSTSRLTVARIADRSGYRSRTHFHSAFVRVTGETPSAYRRRTSI
jgi:AraC-like DNA-binding protein